jgi:hypothetical protein
MGTQVAFVYADWVAAFPMYVSVPQAAVTGFILSSAESYCRNDGGGPVDDPATQLNLLWLMVAHLVQLTYPNGTSQSVGPVGRVSAAGEGSVHVAMEFPTTPNNAWFLQTPWGALFWQMTAGYRMGLYKPRLTPKINPWAGRRIW